MIEKIKIPSSGGKKLDAVIEFSEGEASKLAILCPGYLDSKDYDHLTCLSKSLAKNGYTVVRFDPTGTWDSEGDISEYNISQYLDDLKAVVDYAFTKGSYTSILIGGHSLGGAISLIYAARDNRISKVLAIMPPYAFVRPNNEGKKGEESEWKKSGFRLSIRDFPLNNDAVKKFNVPYSVVELSRSYDVLEEIKKVHIPVFLFAGELDDVILPSEVKLIYDAANEPKRYILLDKIGHDYRHNVEEINKVNKIIVEIILEDSI